MTDMIETPSVLSDTADGPAEGPAFGSFGELSAAPSPASSQDAGPAPSLRALRDVPVRVQAILGRAKMPIAELVRLGPGSVVDLDRRIGEPVDILINDRLIARGEVVLIEEQLGITVTEIVRQDA